MTPFCTSLYVAVVLSIDSVLCTDGKLHAGMTL